MNSKLFWFLAIIIFIYVNAEGAFGAWLVTCTRIKHLQYQYSSYMASAWAGLTSGRMMLVFIMNSITRTKWLPT